MEILVSKVPETGDAMLTNLSPIATSKGRGGLAMQLCTCGIAFVNLIMWPWKMRHEIAALNLIM